MTPATVGPREGTRTEGLTGKASGAARAGLHRVVAGDNTAESAEVGSTALGRTGQPAVVAAPSLLLVSQKSQHLTEEVRISGETYDKT